MGGQSIVYVHNIGGPFLFMYLQQGLFTRGGWVVKKGQNSVYVVIEWPPTYPYQIIFDSDLIEI